MIDIPQAYVLDQLKILKSNHDPLIDAAIQPMFVLGPTHDEEKTGYRCSTAFTFDIKIGAIDSVYSAPVVSMNNIIPNVTMTQLRPASPIYESKNAFRQLYNCCSEQEMSNDNA